MKKMIPLLAGCCVVIAAGLSAERPETTYQSETTYQAETLYGGLRMWQPSETYYNVQGLATPSKFGLISSELGRAGHADWVRRFQRAVVAKTGAPLNLPPETSGAMQDQLAALQKAGATYFIVHCNNPADHVHFLAALKAVNIPFSVLTPLHDPTIGVDQIVFDAEPLEALVKAVSLKSGETAQIAWVGAGAAAAPQRRDLLEQFARTGVQVNSQPERGQAQWIIIHGEWSAIPLWGDEYIRTLRRDHPSAKVAVLAADARADGLVREGLVDVLVRPDWERAFVGAAYAAETPGVVAKVEVNTLTLRPRSAK